jgi:hypothetical protein
MDEDDQGYNLAQLVDDQTTTGPPTRNCEGPVVVYPTAWQC